VNVFGNSEKRIIVVLSSLGIASQLQLISMTGLSERAVKYSVKELVAKGAISEKTDFSDMRRKNYFLKGGEAE
jgi:DNA-binding MarR family transcriptional regulator